jgi:hypothetical protein
MFFILLEICLSKSISDDIDNNIYKKWRNPMMYGLHVIKQEF